MDRCSAGASQQRAPWYSGSGRTSLHYASAHNRPNVVTLLSSNDCTDINIQDDEGCTPLIKATQRDNIECVSALLRHGADPHIMDFNGDAALHHAVCRGNVAIASILLEYKANVYAKTEYGLTPYKLALYEQQHAMAEFLIKNGADAHSECTPNSGGTAAEESEQTKKKYVHFNKEVHYNTSQKPFRSAVRPAGELKSILKKSIQISGDNGRNKDQLSLRLSENPDVPASITEDKASTSDIKEDIENSSCRYTIIQKQNFYSKKIAATKKREQAVLYKSVMDISSLGEAMPAFPRKKSCLMVEKKNTDSFVGAAYPHDVVPQPLAHADSVSSHASDRGNSLQASEKITVHNTALDHTCSLGPYTGHAKGRPHADPELGPGSHPGDTMDPVQHSDPVLESCLEENSVWWLHY